MKAVISVISWAALAAVALAQPMLTNSDFTVKNGQPFTITWSGAQGGVTLTVKTGASTDLKDYATITSGATGTSFSWTPALPDGTYAIQISDDSGVPNYSKQFQITGSSISASASSASATALSTGSTASARSTVSSTSAATTSMTSTSMSMTSSSMASTATSSSASNSTMSTRTSASSTTSSASRTSSAAATTSIANTNGAAGLAAPLAAPLLFLGALAIF